MTVRRWLALFAKEPLRIERVDSQSYDKVVLVLRIELVESSVEFSDGRTWLCEA
jgi:hypothetical protein